MRGIRVSSNWDSSAFILVFVGVARFCEQSAALWAAFMVRCCGVWRMVSPVRTAEVFCPSLGMGWRVPDAEMVAFVTTHWPRDVVSRDEECSWGDEGGMLYSPVVQDEKGSTLPFVKPKRIRVRRKAEKVAAQTVSAPVPGFTPKLTYRDLQALAKKAGIAANQSAEKLRDALGIPL